MGCSLEVSLYVTALPTVGALSQGLDFQRDACGLLGTQAQTLVRILQVGGQCEC